LPPSALLLEQNDYLPFGTRVPVSGNLDNRWRYAGKEEQRIAGEDLAQLDFGARHYDPWLTRWTTQDPLAEKYTSMSPYMYCAGDPVNLVDPQGDTIVVSEKYQKMYMAVLESVFGDFASGFRFDNNSHLTFEGETKSLSRQQRNVLRGLKKIMSQTAITNVVFEYSFSVGGTQLNPSSFGGALTALASENVSLTENYIVVDPNAPSEISTMDITSHYYQQPIDPSGPARFQRQTYSTNITDRTFHELGHVLYEGETQDKVLNFNNLVRSILGMQRRRPDEHHNSTIRYNIY